jgi:hypothetical protein
MARLSILLILTVALLAGCGQVIVFGHVVRDSPQASRPVTPAADTPAADRPTADARGSQSNGSMASSESLGASTSSTSPGPASVAHVVKAVNLIVTAEATAKVTGDASRFSADALLRVTDAAGNDQSTGSRIVAESKLTIAANGEGKNPLGPLYRRFAVLAGDRLAGVASQPQKSTDPARY